MPSAPSVVLNDLTFTWPDGERAMTSLSGAFGRGRTGLIGANGAGKSTLLRLIAGRLRPTRGSVAITGTVDYLPQQLTVETDASLADLLGVRSVVDAVRAVTAGDASPELFDVIGADGWDLEERASAELAATGLPSDLDRRVGELSGGEAMLAGVVGIRLRGASVALLDEPTNNLDGDARERLYDLVRGWRGALIVVSHDTALLELMDDTAELRGGALTVFGGPFSAYRSWLDEQQAAARQVLATAKQKLRVEQRDRIRAEAKVARSAADGRKKRANGDFGKAMFDGLKNSGEKSAAKIRGMHAGREAEARAAVLEADLLVRDDDRISVDLPDPGVARGRRIAVLRGADGREFVMQGPERVALTGPNGAGKTTMLERLVSGDGMLADRVAYLPQRIDTLDETATVLDTVAAAAPNTTTAELRNRLARFLIRGDAIARPISSLSGGERFRVALARLLLADPPAQLLILDEPTNNLDLDSIDRLVEALSAYRGALLVVSHDRGFLERLGLDAELRLEASGIITRV
ncbi:ABC-F family ATP-binding cassette domain-containing protein [Gryllotalpicola protaetiae]|uniref:ABC transporter ATP-binding protein n=1 Tax=Gryllotalpicola protaetiae TaxID=2419771 RepID=A0A387BQQ5_9MICO|nr:ATP-binding cassette domain-containing protein [Gryllotalpicola protaetiae]AYG04882.1 ABC transporter ATP-binding protein [Gryllotalpicola protaetiae]